MNKNFWQLIGLRRSRGFFIVLAVNAALIAALMLWFLPNKDAAQASLAAAEQQKLQLQQQIVELPKKFAQMQKNEADYDVLHQHGFFAKQDRIAFRQILNDLRTSSGVRQVAYDIKPQEIIANQALSNTDKQLISSEVNVTLKGLTDLEMRSFVHVLQDAVPGISTISKQYFRREQELNDENLIKLGNGEPVDFVESGYSFKWYTLFDKNDPYGIHAGEAAPAPGATPVAPGTPVAPTAATVPPIPPVAPAPVAPKAAVPSNDIRAAVLPQTPPAATGDE